MIISVVTPVLPERADYLLDAWRSVHAQDLPPGWELEWCVQVDGVEGSVPVELPADPRVRVDHSGARFGEATTRNLALWRAAGDWVVPLDADDELAAGGLLACARAVERWPDARFVAGAYHDLLDDGTIREFPLVRDEGWVDPGWFLSWEPGRTRTWFCAGGMLHADTLRAIGGWPSLPRAVDVAPWCVINGCFGGVYLHDVIGHYRKWAGQMTAGPDWAATERWGRAALSQVAALARLGGLPAPVAPEGIDLTVRDRPPAR